MYPINLNIKTPWVDGQTKTFTEDSTTPIPPIPPTGVAPVAMFTATPLTGTSPLTVKFTSLSTGTAPLTYKWDFSDGAGNLPENIQQSPTWRFWTVKSYTVKLTVTNAYGSNTHTKLNYITVPATPTPDPIPPIPPIPPTSTLGAPQTVNGYALGGGAGYPLPITTKTASTLTELKTAVSTAVSGDVIFIPQNATIDFGTTVITIPDNVTIASNRGQNGSLGGILRRKTPGTSYETCMMIAGNNTRLTGLIIEGEMYPEDYGNKSGEQSESGYLVGLKINNKSGVIVDNCEGRGFAWSFVSSQGCPLVGRPNIHHNYIHHCQARGEGYGINVYGGYALVEANIFDYNRHSITGAGWAGESYEFRNNLHLGHGHAIGAFHVDVHQDEKGGAFAGQEYYIRNNTVLKGNSPTSLQAGFVHIRHCPTVGAYIENNLIETDYGSGSNEMGFYHVISQSGCSGRVFCKNNMWKGVVYPDNVTILGYP